MLSVDALRRELNKDAARDFFLIVFPVVAPLPPTAVPAVPAVMVLEASLASVELGDSPPFALELAPASSSSCSACAAPSESARRSRPLSPPLLTALVPPKPIAVFSSMAARSESSFDMRRSACALACEVWVRGVGDGMDGDGVV
jgi:hypothetical protein